MNKIKIAPSILAADFSALGDAVRAAEDAGADMIHVDVMDGHFVPPITIGAEVVAALRATTQLPLDVHLMVEAPERHIEDFAAAGATFITCHPEASPHIHRTLQAVRGLGCKAGVVLNPGTPIAALDNLMDLVDLILIMSVNPGWGGQAFIPSQLDKLRSARKKINESGFNILLEVDGGINDQTAKEAGLAGADVLVAGTAVFKNPLGIKGAIESLRTSSSVKGAMN